MLLGCTCAGPRVPAGSPLHRPLAAPTRARVPLTPVPRPTTYTHLPTCPCQFFAAWIVVMTAFVFWCVPETKGVPVESVPALFARHWAWRRVMGPAAEEFIQAEDAKSCASVGSKLEGGAY